MHDLANELNSGSIGTRFSAWLLRPYLDLGPCHSGPTHARSVDAAWQAFAEPASASFFPQRALSPGFRAQLAGQAGAVYTVDDPRDLAPELQTDRWRKLCQDVESWPQLSPERKCRLAALLHVMCLYQPLVEMIPEWQSETDNDPLTAQLAFCRASARFMLELSTRTSSYQPETMSVFEQIATEERMCERVRFNATAMVFVQKAKARASFAELEDWSRRLKSAFADAKDNKDPFSAQLLESRFHRGMGFLPQAADDRNAMKEIMDLAEGLARGLVPTTVAEDVLYRENLHAVLESRTKEALWLNDLDLAEARATELTRVDPYDSKAWIELAHVHYLREDWHRAVEEYIVAAMLGPPASSVGRHMAGVCLQRLGLDFLAAFLFKETLEMDPIGISSREEIFELPDIEVLETLKQWARSNIRL